MFSKLLSGKSVPKLVVEDSREPEPSLLELIKGPKTVVVNDKKIQIIVSSGNVNGLRVREIVSMLEYTRFDGFAIPDMKWFKAAALADTHEEVRVFLRQEYGRQFLEKPFWTQESLNSAEDYQQSAVLILVKE